MFKSATQSADSSILYRLKIQQIIHLPFNFGSNSCLLSNWVQLICGSLPLKYLQVGLTNSDPSYVIIWRSEFAWIGAHLHTSCMALVQKLTMLPQCLVFVETTEVGSRKSGCIWIMCCRSCIWCSVEIAKVLFLVDGHFGMWKVYQLLVYTRGLLPSGMLSQALRDWTYQYNAPIGFSMCLFSIIPFPCCLLICSVFSYLSSYLRTLRSVFKHFVH